ncbi:MAG: glycosyltransferase family 4 protein [Nitrospirota bacterium]|nr:glycosyltransferase family 4 protein [Nitrospirota bacterium]
MNILELCLSPSLGGLELYMYRSALHLSKTDNVLVVINDAGKLKAFFEREGLLFSSEKTTFHSFPMLAAKRLARLIDQRQIDVIHMHWGKDLALAALSKWFSKSKPRLVYTRQMKMTRNKDDFYHNFLYGQMDLMLCITDKLAAEAQEFLRDEYAEKIKRLYYGVDAPPRLLTRAERLILRQGFALKTGDFLVGLFGRIEENKRQHLLVDVIALAKKKETPMRTLIVGHAMKGPYLENLKTRVADEDLKNEVIFKDFVDRPQDWMQACDCVVLATEEETFGLVLIEAMRVGVPVVGTNRGGVPEIIEHEMTGLLFEPDDIEGLYQCLLSLKTDEDLRKKIAEAGEKKAARLFATEGHFLQLREHFKG